MLADVKIAKKRFVKLNVAGGGDPYGENRYNKTGSTPGNTPDARSNTTRPDFKPTQTGTNPSAPYQAEIVQAPKTTQPEVVQNIQISHQASRGGRGGRSRGGRGGRGGRKDRNDFEEGDDESKYRVVFQKCRTFGTKWMIFGSKQFILGHFWSFWDIFGNFRQFA